MRRRILFVFALSFVLVILGQPVRADEPVKHREFVWGVTAFTGQEYQGIFSPPEVTKLYLLSNVTHVLNGHYTMVYYWPIDREYKPDWSALDEEVEGTLEVLDRNGRIIRQIQSEQFLVTNPDSTQFPRINLLLGNEATAVYDEYEADLEVNRDQWKEYDQLFWNYLQAITLDPGNSEIQAPEQPPQFEKALVSPKLGFPLQLPPGEYQIQQRDKSNQIIPGSQRIVISVESRRDGIGYSVIPKTKWTVTETSDDISQIIYYTSEVESIYLEPYATREYNQQSYVRLTKPQESTASVNQWVWVYDKSLEGVQLQVWLGGKEISQVIYLPYKVEQIPGSALGYRVVPFDNTSEGEPSFVAFEILDDASIRRFNVQLVSENGTVVPGSERVLVRIRGDLPDLVYVLALFPLIVAISIYWRQRQIRARSLKELAEAGV
jgi:hypothetical protein